MISEHNFPLINALLEQIFAQNFTFSAFILLENDQKRTFYVIYHRMVWCHRPEVQPQYVHQ